MLRLITMRDWLGTRREHVGFRPAGCKLSKMREGDRRGSPLYAAVPTVLLNALDSVEQCGFSSRELSRPISSHILQT